MHIADAGRFVLSYCAGVVVLAGCGGGSGTPLSPSPAGITAERTHVRPAYGVVYSFKGGTDGEEPVAGLLNVKGTLYGTTLQGGAYYGTVFAITTSGKEKVLHNFGASEDGEAPYAGLLNLNGTLYGTTLRGGETYYGTVFAITTSGKEKVLHNFGGSGDGEAPYAGLINVNGTLYGTTSGGGANDGGTVFKVTTSGKESVLYSFKGGSEYGSDDGAGPDAGLLNVKGAMYGTTEYGGTSNSGTVFTITPSGKETVLHSFGGSGDGSYPLAGLINVKGTLYGTTFQGGAICDCGTVFAITTSGAETVLHSFKGRPKDGSEPGAGLINVNGTLYGTTEYGGARGGSYSGGTVFAVTTSGAETVLHSFKGGPRDGSYPFAGLINVKGTLYGTTSEGGAHGNCGTVFSLTP
jgi:uncharacterized repeat protein (TIGR03803 family)